MNSQQTLDTFIQFFLDRGHRRLNGTTLIPPPEDSSVLFITSGMHPLTPYFSGRQHEQGRRLVNNQRCLRTTDLDEVGDDWHLTLFQMLGTWSLGDYTHSQSLRWGWELLTDGYGFSPNQLSVTVFGGDGSVPEDQDSLNVWSGLGLSSGQVHLSGTENWWSNGPSGPCGPDSEIFVWTGEGDPQGSPLTDSRWVEIWNHVHMRYHRDSHGKLTDLQQPNVDTGLGFERLLGVLQNSPDVYRTDQLLPLFTQVGMTWPVPPGGQRCLTDHLRSSFVIISDGVMPSNSGRGYVLRRLLRRSLTSLWQQEQSSSISDLPGDVISETLSWFELDRNRGQVRTVIQDEENRFRQLLSRGRKHVDRLRRDGPLGPQELRYLHETHGLPPDVVQQLLDQP